MLSRLHPLVIATIVIICCFSFVRPAHATIARTVIYVSTTGNDSNSGTSIPAAKKTIQAAVNAAGAGGIVFIEPGTYTGPGNEAITFGPNPDSPYNLLIESDPGNGTPEDTIIDLQNEDEPAFSIGPGLTSASEIYGLTIENSNYSGEGGAISIEGSDTIIENCNFINNHGADGGAINIANGNPTIREDTFTGNVATLAGFSVGGAIEIATTDEVSSGTFTPIITNCVFNENSAQTDGAAIDISNGLQPVILNVDITNCTFTDNTSEFVDEDDPGGAVGVFSANATFTNNILYFDDVMSGPSGGEITVVSPEDAPDPAVITANFNDIQQPSGTYPGSSNMNVDPLFASGLDLAAGSPAINAGTTNVPTGVDITVDRTERFRDSEPDLGAYEVMAPIANSQSRSTNENTAVSITLVGTDTNVTPRTLTYEIETLPSHGTLSGTPPNLTYTPNTGFTGTDSFTFVVFNGTYTSTPATVTISVTGRPTANSQVVNVPFNTPTGITLTGTDSNNPPEALTYVVISSPAHGTLTGSAPNLTYTPNTGYHGPDSFEFTVTDTSNLTSAPATVTLNVAPGVPTANSQSVSTNENTAVGITLTGSDPDNPPLALTYTVLSNPAHGTLSGTAPNLTYTPNPGFAGTDSFPFEVSNGTNTSTAATVTITVNPVSSVVDVSGQVTVTRGGFRYSAAANEFVQIVTLTNNSATTISGPISLVLSNLSSNAQLANATGATSAVPPAGRPYINLSVASLAPGASSSVTLDFTDPTKTGITYSTQVLAGSGPR